MNATNPVRLGGMVILYAGLPILAYILLKRETVTIDLVAFDVVLASIPMVLVASITWRLVWPKWKLFAKVLVHPCIYAILAVYLGHWSVGIAWIHQGILGLGGHIWFSRKHGFTWYSVEDPERYISLSKEMVGSLRTDVRVPPR